METDQTSLEETLQAELRPSVVVCISHDEAGEDEEEVHCKIAVVEFLVDGTCGEAFEYMEPYDHQGCNTSEAVQQFVTWFCLVISHSIVIRSTAKIRKKADP